MAAGMSWSMEPPVTPEEAENTLLTEIHRIVQTAGGEPDQLKSRYDAEYLAIIYAGHEFAHFKKEQDGPLWIEFEMYEALREKYAPDPLFAGVTDKERRYWRVNLERPQDIEQYRDLIVDETL